MENYHKQAEEIISECIKFVFRDNEPETLALLIQSFKSKHKTDIQQLAKELEHGIPGFMFRALLTTALFDQLANDYFSVLKDKSGKDAM